MLDTFKFWKKKKILKVDIYNSYEQLETDYMFTGTHIGSHYDGFIILKDNGQTVVMHPNFCRFYYV